MQDHNPRKSEQETNGTGSPMSALDRLMLDDTPIPDVFITDYMPELSEQAVKVYLHVSLASTRTRKPIRIKDLSARLNILLPKLEDTLADLLKAGLVQIQDEHVRLTDLKKRAVETIFRAKDGQSGIAASLGEDEVAERQRVVTSINETFFQGLMPLKNYDVIDTLFETYRFEPKVIYQMYLESAENKALHNPNYLLAIARNWGGKHGVRTYRDLEAYYAEYIKLRDVIRQVAKVMKRHITEFDEDVISKWVLDFGYSFDVIELALKETVASSNPNLRYADKTLSRWHDLGLKDVASVEAHQREEKAEREQEAGPYPRGGSPRKRKGNVGNFKQRTYADDDFEQFFIKIPPVDPEEDD